VMCKSGVNRVHLRWICLGFRTCTVAPPSFLKYMQACVFSLDIPLKCWRVRDNLLLAFSITAVISKWLITCLGWRSADQSSDTGEVPGEISDGLGKDRSSQ